MTFEECERCFHFAKALRRQTYVERAIVPLEDLLPGEYAGFAKPILDAFARPAMTTKEPEVAEAIWNAVRDQAGQLRFPAGADAIALAEAR